MAQGQQNDRLKDYIPVATRIADFYERHPSGRIITTIVEHSEETGFVLMRAEVYRAPDDAQPAATGHAFEVKGQGHVNQTSHIENCETGAVGRALALLGLETKRRTPDAPRETSRLDRDIRAALDALGKDDAWLNDKARQYIRPGGSWQDLPDAQKHKVFEYVSNKVNNSAAEAR